MIYLMACMKTENRYMPSSDEMKTSRKRVTYFSMKIFFHISKINYKVKISKRITSLYLMKLKKICFQNYMKKLLDLQNYI